MCITVLKNLTTLSVLTLATLLSNNMTATLLYIHEIVKYDVDELTCNFIFEKKYKTTRNNNKS